MAQLIVEEGAEPGRVYDLHGTVVIGRRAGSSIQVLDSAASSRHAELREVAGGYEIRDLKTSNGTRVNDRLVSQPQLLKGGDRITIGKSLFVYVAEWGAVVPPPARAVARDAPPPPQQPARRRLPEETGLPTPTRFEGGAGSILVILAGAAAALYALWQLLGSGA